jgi:hypothetical protein
VRISQRGCTAASRSDEKGPGKEPNFSLRAKPDELPAIKHNFWLDWDDASTEGVPSVQLSRSGVDDTRSDAPPRYCWIYPKHHANPKTRRRTMTHWASGNKQCYYCSEPRSPPSCGKRELKAHLIAMKLTSKQHF